MIYANACVPTFLAVLSMSGSSNLDNFRDGW